MSARNTDNTVAQKTPIYHNIGQRACGGVAFYWLGDVIEGEPLSADRVMWTHGKTASPGDPVVCGCCGQYLAIFELYGVG